MFDAACFTGVNHFSLNTLVAGIYSPVEVIENRLIGGVMRGNEVEEEAEQMEEAGKAQVVISCREEGMMKDRWRARARGKEETYKGDKGTK